MTLALLVLSLVAAAQLSVGAAVVKSTFQLVPKQTPLAAPVFELKAGHRAGEPGEIVHETVTVCRPNVRKVDPGIDPKISREGPKNLDPKILRRTVCPES